MEDLIKQLDRDLFSMFRAKRKYLEGPYAIFLTDQFDIDYAIFMEAVEESETRRSSYKRSNGRLRR